MEYIIISFINIVGTITIQEMRPLGSILIIRKIEPYYKNYAVKTALYIVCEFCKVLSKMMRRRAGLILIRKVWESLKELLVQDVE